MADPLSAATAVVGLARTTLQEAEFLHDTIQSLPIRPHQVRSLFDELEALMSVLKELESILHTPRQVNLNLLEDPLRSCGSACRECAQVSEECREQSDSRTNTLFISWLKLQCRGIDFNVFKNTLACYRSTIAIVIAGADLQTSEVSLDVILEHQKMIQNTKADLTKRLSNVDDKIRNIPQELSCSNGLPNASYIRAERNSIVRCLEICTQASGFTEEKRQFLLTNNPTSKDKSGFGTWGKLSQPGTGDMLRDINFRINCRHTQLSKRLQDLDKKLGNSSEYQTTSTERSQIVKEAEIIRQCLDICEQSAKDAEHATVNVVEDVAIADDSHHAIVSMIHLIAARNTMYELSTDDNSTCEAEGEYLTSEYIEKILQRLLKSTVESSTKEGHAPLDFEPAVLPYTQLMLGGFIPVIESGILYEDVDDALTDLSSIFSDASRATSITSAGGLNLVADKHVQHLTKSVFCTQELLSIGSAALNDSEIGRQRFQRNVRRLIADFGKSLRYQGMTKDELGVAYLLRTRHFSARIAHEISEQCEMQNDASVDSTPQGDSSGSGVGDDAVSRIEATGDHSETSDDFDEQEDESYAPDFEAIERFLDCEAYSTFKLKLLDFVHGPYEARIWKALGPKAVLDTGEHLFGSDLSAVSQELSWVPTHLLSLSSVERLSVFDLLKGKVEGVMGEAWDWWPLSRRKHPLQSDFIRIKWLTPCKELRHIDIPYTSAQLLLEATSTAPVFVNDAVTVDMTSCSPQTTLASQPSGPSPGGTNTVVSATYPSQTLINSSAMAAVPNTSQLVWQASTAGPFHSYKAWQSRGPRHVFFCVQSGLFRNEHKVIELRTDLLNSDEDLYEWLKHTYKEARGSLAQLFSPWRYDHCDFYQFHKRYEVEPSMMDFPPDDERSYDFVPRPLESHWRPPHGPITATDFRHNYYMCPHHCHSWHKHRYRRTPSHTGHDIQSLPQRTFCINLDDGEKEVFWGICAREKRRYSWILAYGILINIPGVVFFFFMWLFSWGHSSDVQNAAVPLTFSTTLTILFVGLIYESREGKNGLVT